MAVEKYRVFIAEDEPIILLGFSKMVKKCGHEVVGTASNGKQAVEEIIRLKPDIIVTDINMPEIDGLTVIDRVNEVYSVPAVVITGYKNEEYVAKAAQANVYGYLQKPIEENEMGFAIKMAILRHQELKDTECERDEAVTKLEERKIVERAKGILMDRFGLTEPQAFQNLQRKSRNNNKKLVQTAREIIEADKRMQGE